MTDSIVATTFDFKIDDQKTLQIDDQRMQEGFIVQLAMSHKSLHKDKNQVLWSPLRMFNIQWMPIMFII